MNTFARNIAVLGTLLCLSPAGASSLDAYSAAMDDGVARFKKKDYKQAKIDFDSALALATEEKNTHKINCSLFNIYGLSLEQDKFDVAQAALEKILLTIKDDLIEPGLDKAKIQDNLALLFVQKGQFASASNLYEVSLAERKRKKQELLIATSYVNIGSLHEKEGKFGEAERSYGDAMDITRRIRPVPEELLQRLASKLGVLEIKVHDFDAALPMLAQATALAKKLYGAESMQTAKAIGNQAEALGQKGDTEQAMKYYIESLDLMHKVKPGKSFSSMDLEINIGAFLLKQGKTAEAIKYLTSAKETAKNILGTSHPAYKNILVLLAKANGQNNPVNKE